MSFWVYLLSIHTDSWKAKMESMPKYKQGLDHSLTFQEQPTLTAVIFKGCKPGAHPKSPLQLGGSGGASGVKASAVKAPSLDPGGLVTLFITVQGSVFRP